MAKVQLLLPISCSKSFAGFGVTLQMTGRNRFYFFTSLHMEDDLLQNRTELCIIKPERLLLAPLGQYINNCKQLLKESLCSPLGQKWCFNKCQLLTKLGLCNLIFFFQCFSNALKKKHQRNPNPSGISWVASNFKANFLKREGELCANWKQCQLSAGDFAVA